MGGLAGFPFGGVTSFGAFVELSDNRISGMVHVTQMPNDYYHFDQSRMRIWGERSRAGIRLSDSVRVKVLRVDAIERKIDFKLISPLTAVPANELSTGRSPKRGDSRQERGPGKPNSGKPGAGFERKRVRR